MSGIADSVADTVEQIVLDDPENDVQHGVRKLERGFRTGMQSIKSINAVRHSQNRALFETAEPKNYEKMGRFRKGINRTKRGAFRGLRPALIAFPLSIVVIAAMHKPPQ